MDKRTFELDDLYSLKFVSDPQTAPDGSRVAFGVTLPDRDSDGYRTSIWIGGPNVTASAFTHGGKDSTPRFSPSGGRLAFIRPDAETKAQIWIILMDGGEPLQLTKSKLGVTEFIWSPDGSKIAFTEMTRLNETEDRKDHEPIHIANPVWKVDGRGIIVEHRRHLSVIVGAIAGPGALEPVRLTEGDFDVSSLAWSPDSEEIAFSSALHPDRGHDGSTNVFAIKATGGEKRQLTDWEGGASVGSYTPDGSRFVFAGKLVPTKTGHSRLFVVDVAGGIPSEIHTDLDRNVMVGGPGYPGAPPRITRDGKQIIFCARDGGATNAYAISIGGGKAQKLIGDASMTVAGLTISESVIAFAAAGPSSPGDIYVCDLDGSSSGPITAINEEFFAGIELFVPERRTFTAPDGVEIEGWVITGRASEPGPRPLLLEIHGGPHNAYGPFFPTASLHRLELAAKGWDVVFINSRGSDGYGEDFFRALQAGWGTNDYGDFMTAVDVLIEEGTADPDRLALTGYSYGGYMTNWITGHTDRFAAAVTGGCVTNLFSQYGSSDFGGFFSSEVEAEAFANRTLYSELSPISFVENVTTPMLILHGQNDDRCPLGQAEEWFTSLSRQRKTVEMVIYPGASHLFILQGRPSHRIDYSQRLVDWVTHHAAGKGEAKT